MVIEPVKGFGLWLSWEVEGIGTGGLLTLLLLLSSTPRQEFLIRSRHGKPPNLIAESSTTSLSLHSNTCVSAPRFALRCFPDSAFFILSFLIYLRSLFLCGLRD